MVFQHLEFFQYIKDVYSSLTNLHIIITDKEGKQITRQDDTQCLFNLIEELSSFKIEFSEIAHNFYIQNINDSVVYDILPGIKMLICPIHLADQIEFFIFAGYLLEYPSKQSVQCYFRKILKKPENLLSEIFSLIQEYSPDEIQLKKKNIRKMSEILSDRLLTKKLKEDLNTQNKNQDFIFQQLAQDNLGIYDFLEQFYNKSSKLDFVGYARKINSTQFKIVECVSTKNTLKGSVFSIGEGILGQAAATRTEGIWENVDWDPRNIFFQRKDLFPKSIFCFPIIQDQNILGLFFGGSREKEYFEEKIIIEAKLTSSIIKIIENKLYWKRQTKFNYLKNKVLNDIYEFMASLPNIKGVQNFLLDMSLNLTHSPSVSVVLWQATNKFIDIISRGLTEEEINVYTNDIYERYIKNNEVVQLTKPEPIQHITKWNAKVLEIPISYQSEFFGLVCIELVNDFEENEISLIMVLTNACSIAFHLLKILNEVEIEKTIIDLLIKLMESNDPEHLINATKARNIIKGFSLYLSDTKINVLALTYACYFIIYDEYLLREINYDVIVDILREYKLVANNTLALSESSINVQVLTLVWTYINEEQNIKSLSIIDEINDELLRKFTSYISDTSLKNRELTINDDNYTIKEIIKELDLSKRESEVLKLVLKGKSNQEIAGNLFISGHTVKNHLTNIFHKLHVNDRTQAIAKIYQMGYLYLKSKNRTKH